ncbi:MAG: homocysteine S-methyltransferase family protein, partial [Pseudomonadota bacterium]
MTGFLEALSKRVLLCDGATGSRVQAANFDVDKDYWGNENCTEILNLSRADFVRDIHNGYLEAGADVIQTNSFGGSPLTLGEFDLSDQALEINRVAAQLARACADAHATADHPRYVVGSIGPGTRLPSLGHTTYDALEEALTLQSQGLIEGGIDAFLIETCQDPLQIKAAVNGAKAARGDKDIPIIVQVTVETTGTLLVGTDIAAAATVIESLDVPVIGLNCATGPQEMAEHLRWLSQYWSGMLSLQPNAGLPELIDGQTVYPLQPADLESWMERYIREDGLNLIGGCCGTTMEHIARLDGMLRRLSDDGYRPAPVERTPEYFPSVASLYTQTPLRQENAYLSIGERCNANGSRKFRELQEAENWDGCCSMGRAQVQEGSHTLDVCTAFVGRDEVSDMINVVRGLTSDVTAPLVFDSTELPVLEAAMKLYGGKSILNSINFEDGEEAPAARMELAK